jgi:hypothetical protein
MMGRKKKGAPVVITRKDKRLNKTGHGLAFILTGGMSSVYTATKAATNAGYNARTRKLVAENEQAEAEQAAEEARQAAALIALRPQSSPRRRLSDVVYDDPAQEFRAEHVPTSKEYRQRYG